MCLRLLPAGKNGSRHENEAFRDMRGAKFGLESNESAKPKWRWMKDFSIEMEFRLKIFSQTDCLTSLFNDFASLYSHFITNAWSIYSNSQVFLLRKVELLLENLLRSSKNQLYRHFSYEMEKVFFSSLFLIFVSIASSLKIYIHSLSMVLPQSSKCCFSDT